MKHNSIIAIFLIALSQISQGAITFNTFFGVAYSSDGTTPMPDNTLWIMIVDNGDGILPGGLQANTSLNANEDESSISADFNGLSVSLGTLINGDKIFAFGGMNGFGNFGQAGISSEELTLSVGINAEDELASGDIGDTFGFYWFPGIEYTGEDLLLSTVLEVGGISDTTGADSGFAPMVIPGDGNSANPGAATPDVGGTFSNERFTAVAIPEPTALGLTLLGAVMLLFRRRV